MTILVPDLRTLNLDLFSFSATIPVTLNGGFRMPAWFDIYSLDRSGQQDEPGILKAAESGMCWIGPDLLFRISHLLDLV